MKTIRKIIAVSTAVMMFSACATVTGREQTVLERSIVQCIAAVGVGTAVGAGIGAATRNTGRGAAIGAGVGAVACGVLIALNARDKQRILEAERRAVSSGKDTTEKFVTHKMQPVTVQTIVRDEETPSELIASAAMVSRPPTTAPERTESTNITPLSKTNFVGPCRRAQIKITTAKGETAELPPELLCRTSQGDWLPYNNVEGNNRATGRSNDES